MNWSAIARGLALVAASFSVHASCEGPEPFSASYKAEVDKIISLDGKGVQRLVKGEDDVYRFDFDVESLVADMRERSEFLWDEERCHLVPLSYRNKLDAVVASDRSASFVHDRDDKMIRGSYRGSDFAFPSHPRYVDPLGMQIQVRQDLKAGKTTMKYHMIHKGKALVDKYQVVGEEVLEIDSKSYKTVRIEKVRPDTSDRETYLWMAPDLDYTLIRLLHQEPDGDRYEVIMTDFKAK